MAEYYVGGEVVGPSGQDDQNLGALQFAAKLHEFLMLPSLTAVLFTYIRCEWVFGEGIPHEAWTASFETEKFCIPHPSKRWGVIWPEWKRAHKKCSVRAVATFPKASPGNSRVYSFTINSRSANTTISAKPDNPKVVTGNPEDFHVVCYQQPTLAADRDRRRMGGSPLPRAARSREERNYRILRHHGHSRDV
ncbi:uncharacterized protein Z519_03460 [Cladophialophora bantiana CBS 173.52]|uniref:Uncharacterized protein n=1 Tax=Cladophialophora bantiana (strain ATCC 10958 / CBS 173.52 / CDC B-1940 / NIH 8579) TaxID=1442370 RepID=A0A0D2F2G1_CLAB1|nr:uncharacterized protein Z519_03460 [Cladophialophora bantiana CBS 173.52]KIW96391.1 hypothetical protein Z519_03460 [Cladophialophora bantiana CBS 173.52]